MNTHPKQKQTATRTSASRQSRTPRRRALVVAGVACVAIAVVAASLLIARDAAFLPPPAGETASTEQPPLASTRAPATGADTAVPSAVAAAGRAAPRAERASPGAGQGIRSGSGAASPGAATAPAPTRDDPLSSVQHAGRDPAAKPREDLLSISGKVLDDFGEPVTGLEINAVARKLFDEDSDPEHRGAETEQFTMTQFDGGYVFFGLPDGEYDVRTVQTESYSQAQMLVRAGTDSANLMVNRQRVLTLHGTVTGPDRTPLAGVRVLPIGQPEVTASDREGRFQTRLRIKSDARQQVVRFDGAGYQVKDVRLEEAELHELDAVEVNVVLRGPAAQAEVSGTVTGIDGEAVSGETVRLSSPSRNRDYFVDTDRRGFFSLRDVDVAEDYQLWIRPRRKYADYGESDLPVTRAGLSLDIVLETLGRGRLSGRILTQDGTPIPGFTLWLRSTMASGQSVQVTSNARGEYAVDDVPPGNLVFETRSFPIFRVTGVYLEPGGERNVDVVLDRGDRAIRGRIVNRYGDPVPGAEVFVYWRRREQGVGSRSTRRTVSEVDGYFALTQLSTGPHTLDVRAPGYPATRFEHQVGADEREIEVVLE